nr:hypothetical protein HAV00_25385 [Bradyrhizobium symbiodeficiens]
MTKIFLGPAAVWMAMVGIAGLLSVGLGIYWLFNKRARLRDLTEMRKRLDELRPSDPEYGAVRALYTSMMIDAERWSSVHSGSGSHGDTGSADHRGGDHVGDDGSGGGHH